MRMFFDRSGNFVVALALAVLWIFAESGGALTVIAAGIFAVVAVVALGCERILKTLEEIRDRAVRACQHDTGERIVRRAAKSSRDCDVHAPERLSSPRLV